MNFSFRSPKVGFMLAALMLVGLALASAPANAQQQVTLPFEITVSGALQGVGTIPGPPLLFENLGTGTVSGSLGLTSASLHLFLNPATGVAFGDTIYMTASGDSLFSFTNDDLVVFPPPGSDMLTFSGTETFTGGTGIFAGATGGAAYTGTGVITPTGNTFTYTSRGTITLNVVPEPGTLALAGMGLLPLAGAVARKRRRSN